jgi:hypothetical protein
MIDPTPRNADAQASSRSLSAAFGQPARVAHFASEAFPRDASFPALAV